MNIPIVKQYKSLGEQDRAKVDELAGRCDVNAVAEFLGQVLGRRVSDKEARYLVLTLNPDCAETGRGKGRGRVEIDESKYYADVDVMRELNFLYNFQKERLISARRIELENDNIPLSATDKIVELLVKMLEMRLKNQSQANPFEELKRILGGDEEGGGE